jgi:hypothetical protein
MTDHYEAYESSPDLDELLQQEMPTLATVPVEIKEAVETYALPNRRVRCDSQVTGADFVKVLDASRKRSVAYLVSNDQPMRVRTSSSGVGMKWPQNVPLRITHTEAVYVSTGATNGTVTEIGVTEEFWAD